MRRICNASLYIIIYLARLHKYSLFYRPILFLRSFVHAFDTVEDAFRRYAEIDAMINLNNKDSEATYQMGHNQFSAIVIAS